VPLRQAGSAAAALAGGTPGGAAGGEDPSGGPVRRNSLTVALRSPHSRQYRWSAASGEPQPAQLSTLAAPAGEELAIDSVDKGRYLRVSGWSTAPDMVEPRVTTNVTIL
jgi:hypothetical protein